jgi:hypothetical protein
MRKQQPVKGGRLRLSPSVAPAIRRGVERTARQFNVSMSFVTATALADSLGINIERYYISDVSRRKKRA